MGSSPQFSLQAAVCIFAFVLINCSAGAEVPAGAPPAISTNLPLRQIGPGLFELGKVRLDKTERTVRFPAAINQTEGAIEYLLVTSFGKTHESLFRTDAEPYHIQLALLLLGAKGAGTNSFPETNSLPIPGDPVAVEVTWPSNGQEKRARAEEFIYNLQSKSVMKRGEWIFNGSRVVEGNFIAQQDGSIISVMVDADALINNPRPGRENDKIWQVNAKGLPPLNSPVDIIIRLIPERTNKGS